MPGVAGVSTHRDLREIYRVRGDAGLASCRDFYTHNTMSDSEAPSPKRQKMESKKKIPPVPEAYVKDPPTKQRLHPHYRKHFPDDEEDEKGRGKVWHGGPEGCGVWRIVPGFWWIIASSLGHIATRYDKKVRKQTLCEGYFKVYCNKNSEQVHNLVVRAFHGVPEENEVSVDHIHGNTQDNRASELAWTTAVSKRSRPIWIWKLETPDVKIFCQCQQEAVEKYGLARKNLGAVLYKRKNSRGYLRKSVKGYGARFADEEE